MESQVPALLQSFFLLHRRFSIPALGTVLVKKAPAYHDFSNNLIYPAKEEIEFNPEPLPALIGSFEKYALALKSVTREEIEAFFMSLKADLKAKGQVEFKGIGVLSIEHNTYRITANELTECYLPPVPIKALIHEGELHEIKVGEDIRTNAEMKALLAERKTKDYWWVYALILLVVAVGAILYYVYGPA
jgi:hypothetical protein